jgi:hypothetical protein
MNFTIPLQVLDKKEADANPTFTAIVDVLEPVL